MPFKTIKKSPLGGVRINRQILLVLHRERLLPREMYRSAPGRGKGYCWHIRSIFVRPARGLLIRDTRRELRQLTLYWRS